MLRKIWHLAWNDVKVYFASPTTLVFFLILPVIFTGVVGAGLQGSFTPPDPNVDRRYPILVADLDGSTLSNKLIAVLESSTVIRPVVRPQAEAERLFAEENVAALLILPQGFEKALLAGDEVDVTLRRAPNDDRVLSVEQAVYVATNQIGAAAQIAHQSVAEAERAVGLPASQRQAYFQEALDMALAGLADPPATVEVTTAPEVTLEVGSSFDQSSAGQLVTWVMITLLGVAEMFVAEREGGTLRRLLVTPTDKAVLLGGKIVGRLGMGLVQMVILVVVGALVFGVNWGRSPAALAIMLLAFGLASVAMGTLLGTLAKSAGQADGLVTMAAMVGAALGGCWWPLEVTPPAYQTVVKVLPSTWAMAGFKDVIIRGQGVSGVLPEAGVLLGFTVVLFGLAIWRFRFE